MSPASLLDDGEPAFMWSDETKFKNLGTTSQHDAAVLGSFSVSVGRCALTATPRLTPESLPATASGLRTAMLARWDVIGLRELLVLCWTYGIPVLQLRVFPLRQKRMHAVTARLNDRHAVLIGHESRFQAQVAYWLAHELGHIANGHVGDAAALMDVDDPLRIASPDDEEGAADTYALELLTGFPSPIIEPNVASFSATEVAHAVGRRGAELGVDPGVLALCLGHSVGAWEKVFGALKILGEVDVGTLVNDVARGQMDWPALSLDSRAFLVTILGLERG